MLPDGSLVHVDHGRELGHCGLLPFGQALQDLGRNLGLSWESTRCIAWAFVGGRELLEVLSLDKPVWTPALSRDASGLDHVVHGCSVEIQPSGRFWKPHKLILE